MNKGCSTCKKKIAVRFDNEFGVGAILCEYEPYEFEWKNPIEECENYESNLHDNRTARSDPQTRNNGIHQEE